MERESVELTTSHLCMRSARTDETDVLSPTMRKVSSVVGMLDLIGSVVKLPPGRIVPL